MESSNARRIVYLGLMTGLSMGLHIFESMIPVPTNLVVPGAKLGLANIVSLYVIMNFGTKDAVIVAVLRTVLTSLMAGTFLTVTFFFSFFGGLVSALVMGIAYKLFGKHFSMIGISLLGALTHNLTQLLVAAVFIENIGILLYLPYMLLFAVPTGIFVGIVTNQVNKYYSIS